MTSANGESKAEAGESSAVTVRLQRQGHKQPQRLKNQERHNAPSPEINVSKITDVSWVARVNQFLPRMTNPWLLAPAPLPVGVALDKYRLRIGEMQTSIWESMHHGFRFETLPFLDYEDTEHLVCSLVLFPDDSHGHLCTLLTIIFTRIVSDGHYYLAHSVDQRLLVHFYAYIRQRYYNSLLIMVCSAACLQMAAAVAAVKPHVLMQVMEAVVKARRAYKETQTTEAKSGQQNPSEPEHGGTDDSMQELEKAVEGWITALARAETQVDNSEWAKAFDHVLTPKSVTRRGIW